MTTFNDLGLQTLLLTAIHALGYQHVLARHTLDIAVLPQTYTKPVN